MNFYKMHGCGNDFVLIDHSQFKQPTSIPKELIIQMAARQDGVGFDQMLELFPTDSPVRYRLQISNADGSRAGQCGNGLRCVARYLQTMDTAGLTNWTITTQAGNYAVKAWDNTYQANLGKPLLDPTQIPFNASTQSNLYRLQSPWGVLSIGVVNVGNPHAVLRIDDETTTQMQSLVNFIAKSALFPEGVNVGVVQVTDVDKLTLHVYERGTGWTRACGSGACASVIVALQNGWLSRRKVTVEQPGGCVDVQWDGNDASIYLTGNAELVFKGHWI